MKSTMKKMAILCMAMMMSAQADAQFGKVLKNAASGILGGSKEASAAVDAVTNIVGNILGTDKLSEKNIIGTWTYNEPCVVFESENVLTQVGATAASNKVEKTLGEQLTKVGIVKGSVILKFNEGGEGIVTSGGKDINIKWAVKDSNLTLTFPVTQQSITVNAKITAGGLQIAVNADKLLTLVNGFVKNMPANSSLSSISSLMNTVKGMYVGLKFTK